MRFVPRGTRLAALLCFALGAPALAQQPATIYAGRVTSLGYCQLAAPSASTALTACVVNGVTGIPSGANFVDLIVENNAIRYRTDGVAPTAAVGMPLQVGTDKVFALSDLTKLLIIQEAVSATVDVEFFR